VRWSILELAAWKTKPAWGIVSSADHTINPDVERFVYKRGNFRAVIEIDVPSCDALSPL